MTNWTLAQIKSKLSYDQDVFDDAFVDLTTELPGYINEAIDDAEAVIHNLYEDYFLCKTTIALVSGTAVYALPSDIYAQKIRGLFYNDPNGDRYIVRKMGKLSDTLDYDSSDTTSRYRFVVTNTLAAGPQIRFYRTPAETNSLMDLWYIRNAKVLVNDSDACDIPEFINFILAHSKYSIAAKERLPLDMAALSAKLDRERALMVDTLTNMVPDETSNQIPPDTSFYDDFGAEDFRGGF